MFPELQRLWLKAKISAVQFDYWRKGIKLDDCPFCGAPVLFHSDPVHCDGCHVIACTGCGVHIDFFPDVHPRNEASIDRYRMISAKQWNFRAPR